MKNEESTIHNSLNTQHSTFNTQHSTFNTKHSTLNIQHSTFNTQHSTLNTTLQEPKKSLAFGFFFIYNRWCRVFPNITQNRCSDRM